MPLRSRLRRGDSRLEDCLVKDQAHLTIGSVGPFVRKVQQPFAMLRISAETDGFFEEWWIREGRAGQR